MAKKFLSGLDASLQKLVNLADGTNPADAVNLAQVQALIRGLVWKASVKVASTTNLTLSGTQTIDTVAVVAGDRVLAKNQTTASANGVYVVAAGAWTRATDFDDTVEVKSGAAIPVEQGSASGDSVQILTTDTAITIGTTALAFTRLGGSGATYTAGANGGLTLSGSAFSILLDTDSGLVLGAGGIKIDPTFALLAKRYAVDVPTGSTTATITHNLGTKDVTVAVFINATGEEVDVDVVRTTTAALTLTFGVAPTTGQYRCVVTA